MCKIIHELFLNNNNSNSVWDKKKSKEVCLNSVSQPLNDFEMIDTFLFLNGMWREKQLKILIKQFNWL